MYSVLYIPINPYEWVRYPVYILLVISFVSLIWNRCNERTVYTLTWAASFIGSIGSFAVYGVLAAQHIMKHQPEMISENLLYRHGSIYALAFLCLLLFTAVMFLAQREKLKLSPKKTVTLLLRHLHRSCCAGGLLRFTVEWGSFRGSAAVARTSFISRWDVPDVPPVFDFNRGRLPKTANKKCRKSLILFMVK